MHPSMNPEKEEQVNNKEYYSLEEITEEMLFLINNRFTEEEKDNGILTIRRGGKHTMDRSTDGGNTFKPYNRSDAIIPIKEITNIYTVDPVNNITIEYKDRGSKISILRTSRAPIVMFFSYNEELIDSAPVYLRAVLDPDNRFIRFK